MITQINNYTCKSFKNYTGTNVNESFKQKNIFFDIMLKEKHHYQNKFYLN